MNIDIGSIGTSDRILAGGTVIALLICSYALGRVLFFPRTPRQSPAAEAALNIILGFNVISILALVSGTAGIASGKTVLVFMLIGTALGIFLIFRDLCRILPFNMDSPFFSKPGIMAGFGICFTLFFIYSLGSALCLPVAWDELVYQITVPYRWMLDQFPKVYSDLPYSGFPGAYSFLQWWALSLGGILAPRILNASMWMISAMCLFALARNGQAAGQQYGRLTLSSAFLLSPVMLMVSSAAYAEIFMLLQLAGAILVIHHGKDEHSTLSCYVLCGFFAGFAIAIKLTGIGVAVAILIMLFVLHPKHSCRKIPIFILAMLISALPFYLRPWILTGNPFYPYFAAWFGQAEAIIEMSQYHHAAGADKFGLEGLGGLPLNILLITGMQRLFDGTFGWQWLLFLFLSIYAWPIADRRSKSGILAALAIYIFWNFTTRQARFLIPIWLLLLPATWIGLNRLPKKIRAAGCAIIIALTLFSIPLPWWKNGKICWQVVSGHIRNQDYFYTATGSGYLPAIDIVKSNVPENEKILLLFEHRTLYIPRECKIGSPFFQSSIFSPPEAYESPTRIMKTLAENDFRYLLVGLSMNNPDHINRYLQRCQGLSANIAELEKLGRLRLIWRDQAYILYELR